MKRTISFMTGKGSVNHNSRKFHAKNTDPERSCLNVEYCNENVKDVYHELFDEALARYNEKQTRSDRRIDDYYEKIRSGKQEKPFHEIILQIGDKDNMGAKTENGQLAAKVLDKYMWDFQRRNPTLRVFSAYLIIVSIAFCVVRLMPGSVYDQDGDLSQTVIDTLNEKYHFDEPIIKQYGYFLKNVFLHGDWGTSMKMRPNVPVFEVMKDRIPVTLQINLISLFAAIPIGLAAGIVAAIKKNTIIDHFVSFMVVIFISVPSFVFATCLQYFVGYKAGAFPIIYDASATGMAALHSMFLPILALMFSPIARVARYLRAELAETMNSEFMLLAKTKGLTYAQSTIRHGLRNSMVPLANIIIPMFANVLGGSLVVENIFSVPGMGGLMVDSINASDHMLTVAILVFYSMISLITVLIVDISYGIIDPRVRMGGKK